LIIVPEMGTIGPVMGTKKKPESLAAVLFGKTRRALLSLLYCHADESFYLMQLVRAAGVGKGTIQRELKLLTEVGIIHREKIGRQVFYRANNQCSIYEELRNMIIKTMGYVDVLKADLAPIMEDIKVAFIYGSVARANEYKDSDVDILIIGNIDYEDVVSAFKSSSLKLKREINPTIYPIEEFKSKLKVGNDFLQRVLSDTKIYLIGDDDELSGLAGQ